MLFNSYEFLLFFPAVVLVYFIIPKRFQQVWLLLASYYFYMSWNAKYIVLLLFATVVTYAGGLGMDFMGRKKPDSPAGRRICLAVSIVANLSLLFFFKYVNFAVGYLNRILGLCHIRIIDRTFDVLLPVGISFFTFQAIGYVIDVYRGKTKAEKNFVRYALFIAFFPQLVAGPIERSGNLLGQVGQTHKFRYDRVKNGLLLMLWGFFLKIVLADRIAVIVDKIYGEPNEYNGLLIVVATVLFGFQIYCDFCGYSTIARGAARVMGFELMENFKAPYLAMNVTDFWRRWHISLTGWFRDYLYIPLGGNRKGRLRRYVNIMIVFLASGLWHGASLSFVIWGGLNGVYQIVEDLCKPFITAWRNAFPHDREWWGYRWLCRLGTFLLVDFSWFFFRAGSLSNAAVLWRQMTGEFNPWIFFSGVLYELGLGSQEFFIMLVSIVVLLWVDSIHERGLHVLDLLEKRGLLCRTLAVSGLFFAVVMLGVYGSGQDVATFIYFAF